MKDKINIDIPLLFISSGSIGSGGAHNQIINYERREDVNVMPVA